MVVFSFLAKSRVVAGALAAISMAFGANPALANSSASAADVTAPLRAVQAARPSGPSSTDEQFRQLFANWKAIEGSGASLAAARAPATPVAATARRSASRVSIPSRMPVEGVRLTSDYGMRVHPVLGGMRKHKGIDLAAPSGTPIYATADGVVSKAEWFSGYGLYIALEHGGEIQTRYGHMSRLNVAAGQQVRKGDIIGFVGSTGRSTGPHLHYEVRIAGEAMNPMPYLQTDQMLAALDPASTETGKGGPN